jgi:uncharacterized membrane protein
MFGTPRRPRTVVKRLLIAGLLDLAAYGTASGLVTLAEYRTGNRHLIVLAYVVLAPLVAWLAPKVSYRRRDALIAPWAFAVIAWRIAYLPYRDWPPRDDEMHRAQYLRQVDFGDQWRPELAIVWRMD